MQSQLSSNFEYGGALTGDGPARYGRNPNERPEFALGHKKLALHEQRRRQRVNQSALPRRLEVVAI